MPVQQGWFWPPQGEHVSDWQTVEVEAHIPSQQGSVGSPQCVQAPPLQARFPLEHWFPDVQQGSLLSPQCLHCPDTQTAEMPSQVSPAQQASPFPPQATHWEATQARPVPHAVASQQGSKSLPHSTQEPLEQAFPALQVMPAQHGWVTAPQSPQVLLLHTIGEVQGVAPEQQGSPAPPHAQTFPAQMPVEQAVPGVTLGLSQAPPVHLSRVHSLASSHDLQSSPPVAHSCAEVPSTQVCPFQHPLQHSPFQQAPLVHEVWSVTWFLVQAPAEHVSSVHSLSSLQFVQAAPPLPHAPAELRPATHCVPSQQPWQHAP